MYGAQNASLFFLGAVLGLSNPGILELWQKFTCLLSPGKDPWARQEARTTLMHKIKMLDLPPGVEVDEMVSHLRELVITGLDQDLDIEFAQEDNTATDLSSDPESPSSHGSEDMVVQNGIDQGNSMKRNKKAQKKKNPSGAWMDTDQGNPKHPRLRRRLISRPESEGTLPRKDEEG